MTFAGVFRTKTKDGSTRIFCLSPIVRFARIRGTYTGMHLKEDFSHVFLSLSGISSRAGEYSLYRYTTPSIYICQAKKIPL